MRLFILIFMVLSIPALAQGEEEKKKNWSNNTELSAVQTGGNSESSSFGLHNKYVYSKGKGKFKWDLLALRVETRDISISASGTADNPSFQETKTSSIATEQYLNTLKYERSFAKRTSWFVGGSWEQDEPKGIEERTQVTAGISNQWIEKETRTFSTSYGFGMNNEDLVNGDSNEFGSAELGYDLMMKFKNATFDQSMSGNANLEESEDWRLLLKNGLSVSFKENLALKLSLNLEYNNTPNFLTIDLGDTGQTVNYELDELDTQFTTSLVITF